MSFNQFILREQYQKIRGLGDRLEFMKKEVEWEPFKEIIKSVFYDNKTQGGRPHTDELVLVRTLILQGLYGLSDPELEFQVNDRLSFRNFIGFPESIPDFTTIWRLRDRLQKAEKDKAIWDELQRQIDSKGLQIKKGVVQDATFVEADLGKKRYSEEKKAKKESRKIEYTKKQLAHQDKDAKFAIKSNQIHYGYKTHAKMDLDHDLIRSIEVTPANIHDNNINLIKSGDVAAYRDRGYSGTEINCPDVIDKTMIRKDAKKEWVKATNKAISKIRVRGERPFAVTKNIFNGARTRVKNLARVYTKEIFKYFGYNLYQLVTLTRKKLAIAM